MLYILQEKDGQSGIHTLSVMVQIVNNEITLPDWLAFTMYHPSPDFHRDLKINAYPVFQTCISCLSVKDFMPPAEFWATSSNSSKVGALNRSRKTCSVYKKIQRKKDFLHHYSLLVKRKYIFIVCKTAVFSPHIYTTSL